MTLYRPTGMTTKPMLGAMADGDVIVGTAEGLLRVGEEKPEVGEPIAALAIDGRSRWILTDHGRLLRDGGSGWEDVASLDGRLRGRCLLTAENDVLVGTSGARLFRLRGAALEADASFDRAPGREAWYTPWGGPPDTRSLAAGHDATFANVHVGGILRRSGGAWEPTIDIDADVHQVTAHPRRTGLVLAATARGLATSTDGGTTWTTQSEGLHGSYCRAVVVSGDTVVMSASTGPFTELAGVYRRPLSGGRFERCVDGLPDWFPSNIDTYCLAALDNRVVLGTDQGGVWTSNDQGVSWTRVAKDLPAIRCVGLGAQT
jgi:hypothetical protein